MDTDLLWIGVLLLTGFVLFAGGVMLPERGGIGRRVWSVPHEEVGKNPRIWKTANVLFIASGVASAAGIVSMGILLFGSGSRLLAPIAATLFVLATLLWIVFSAFRSGVIPWAAASWMREGATPPVYEPLSSWAYVLGSVYMMLGYLSAATLGGALLQAHFLPSWIGWFGIVWGLLFAGVMAIGWPRPAGEEGTIAHIPAWVQIVPSVIGIVVIIEAL